MKKHILVCGAALLSILVFMVALIAMQESVSAEPDDLPTAVEFLGEGPGTFNTTLEDIIVGRGGGVYDLLSGTTTYDAASGERVWGVSGANGEPPTPYSNAIHDLGPAFENCVVEYIGIDDDINGVHSGFWVGSELLEVIVEGMTFQGDFVIPYDSNQFRLTAEEVNYIALWYSPCEDPDPPTPTWTPDPSLIEKDYLPAIFREGIATTPTETPVPEPDSYSLECVKDRVEVTEEELKFFFYANAYNNGEPVEDVNLVGTVDTGDTSPSAVEATNFDGKADFRIVTLITAVSQTPIATVTFEDSETFGTASCTVNFDEPPPTPTPTVPPQANYDVVCNQEYDVYVHQEKLDFIFSATAYNNGIPLEGVDLRGILITGGASPFNDEETNFNGVADFNLTVDIWEIDQLPVAIVKFSDQGTFGDASCTIPFASPDSMSLLWSYIND